MSIESGERICEHLEHNPANRQPSTDFDLADETETLIASVGASPSESGGASRFYGSAPIVRNVIRFEAAAAALADKALQSTLMWRLGTGECQDVHVDVRKATLLSLEHHGTPIVGEHSDLPYSRRQSPKDVECLSDRPNL